MITACCERPPLSKTAAQHVERVRAMLELVVDGLQWLWRCPALRPVKLSFVEPDPTLAEPHHDLEQVETDPRSQPAKWWLNAGLAADPETDPLVGPDTPEACGHIKVGLDRAVAGWPELRWLKPKPARDLRRIAVQTGDSTRADTDERRLVVRADETVHDATLSSQSGIARC